MSVTDKLSQTALGLILTMVMPLPGSVEVGMVSIGALWLQGDSAGKHLVVEHPEQLLSFRSVGLLGLRMDPFERFRQVVRPSGQQLLEKWARREVAPMVLAPWPHICPREPSETSLT